MPGTSVLPLVLTAMFALQPPGHFHGDEPVARDGERWLALRVAAGKASLVATAVSVRPAFDALHDEPGQRSGRNVSSLLGDTHVLALLRGPGLIAAPVDLAEIALTDPDATLPGYRLTLHGQSFVITTRCDVNAFEINDGQPQYHCRIALEGKSARQVLSLQKGYREAGTSQMRLSGDGNAKLLFAGDIDHDGRLDLLFDTSDHYNVSRPVLYLSSQAGDRELVGEAAQYSSTGC